MNVDYECSSYTQYIQDEYYSDPIRSSIRIPMATESDDFVRQHY